jgi:hypothetical protein
VRSDPGELGGANLIFVEDVAYQKAAIQEMERALLPVIPMKPQGDKRARLQVVAPYIKNGTVLFPRSGCEELLGQMFNLGVESHDDLNERARVPIAGACQSGIGIAQDTLDRCVTFGPDYYLHNNKVGTYLLDAYAL